MTGRILDLGGLDVISFAVIHGGAEQINRYLFLSAADQDFTGEFNRTGQRH